MAPYTCPITLADHQDRDLETFVAQVEIEMDGVLCQHSLVVIPSFVDTPVLLGIDFLEKIGVQIDHYEKNGGFMEIRINTRTGPRKVMNHHGQSGRSRLHFPPWEAQLQSWRNLPRMSKS